MHITRRDFLRSAAMSAALAAASGFPLPKDADAAAAAQPEKWVKGVCRYCGTGCGVLIHAKDGQLLSVTGDPDNLTSRGLNCSAGASTTSRWVTIV